MEYKVGLALSGGSIKGFAHLGVMQYLDERGIKPDIIAGTSAGALMGVFYADGHKPWKIFELFADQNFFGLTALRPNSGGVFSTDKFSEFIDEHLHQKYIEDLAIPMRIVATDLDKGRAKVFSKGAIVERVVASCSIPILFHPMEIDGTTYVDGGLFRNFPATIIREACQTLIGVNLGAWQTDAYEKTISDIAERSWEFVFRQNTLPDRAVCDYLLENDAVSEFGMFEVGSAQEIFDIGYRMAEEKLKGFSNKELVK